MTNTRNTTRIITTIIMIIIYLSLIGLLHKRNAIIDDAFITYRYASNLIEGNGMVYNEGEAVLGTTTPGYTLILASVGIFTGSDLLPLVSLWINIFATIALLICIAVITYKLSDGRYYLTVLSPLIALGSVSTMEVMTLGMEGSVLLLMIVGSLTLIVYERWVWASFIAGLTIWLRPEGAFLIGLIGLTILALTISKRMSLREFVTYGFALVSPVVGYVLMLIIFYGTWLPQSVISKGGGLYPGQAFSQVNLVLQYVISPLIFWGSLFFGAENNPVLTNPTIFIAMIPIALFFLVIGSIQIVKINKLLWIVPAFMLMNILFYSSRSTLLFVWYHANYHLFVVLLFTLGVGQFTYQIVSSFKVKQPLVIASFFSLLIVCVPNILATPYLDYAQTPRQRHFVGHHIRAYHDLLVEIGDDIPPDAVVALHEIGYLGFHMRENHILDTAGLVSPEFLAYFPIPLELRGGDPLNGAIPPQSMLDYDPDVIITLDSFVEYGLYEADWFDEMYSIEYRMEDVAAFNTIMNLDVIVPRDALDTIQIDPTD